MYSQGEVSRCMAADIGYGKLLDRVRVRVRVRVRGVGASDKAQQWDALQSITNNLITSKAINHE